MHTRFWVTVGLCLLVSTAYAELPPANASVIGISNTLAARYLYPNIPDALGALDRVRYSDPFYVLTMSLDTESGVSALIVGSWVSEYQRDDAFSIPWGPPGNRVAAENNSVTAGVLFLPTVFGSLSMGRQHVSLGPSGLSNLQIAQHIPFLDAVVLDVPMGRWAMRQVVATLENRRPGHSDPGVQRLPTR